MNPYVVSEDIPILLRRWGERGGWAIPEIRWVAREVGQYLRCIFPRVEVVGSEELEAGISGLVDGAGLLPVSFDPVYYPTTHLINTTRLVSANGEIIGQGPRPPETLSLRDQIDNLITDLARTGNKEVVLVDDVLFSGDLFVGAVERLLSAGIRVPLAVIGVAKGEGIDRLSGFGVEVRAVRIYPQMVDEVCQRDFVPGVPFSGNSVVNERRMCVPYILPFGRPRERASIPTPALEQSFSKFCLDITAELFEGIQNLSGRPIYPDDLDRVPLGLNSRDTFPHQLRRIAATL